jgi:hypothetical protein
MGCCSTVLYPVQQLDAITRKLVAPATPVLDVAQDAPQYQTESNQAIEAEVVTSEAPNQR